MNHDDPNNDDPERHGSVEPEDRCEAVDDKSGPDRDESLHEQRDRLKDQLARAMADLQNLRKRHGRELEEARRRAKGDIAHELLPVLDNFQLALDAHEQQEAANAEAMAEGVRMVRSLLSGALERHGLAEIPTEGEVFDPNVHEAVGIDPTAKTEPGRVTQVIQRGYMFGDRVLRASRVLVSGESPMRADATDGGDNDAPSGD